MLVTFNGLAPNTADTNGSLSGLANTLGAVAPLWTNLVLSPTGKVTFRFVEQK